MIDQDFSRMANHIQSTWSEKCCFEIIEGDSIQVIMLWYIDINDDAFWINANTTYDDLTHSFKLQVIDENINIISSDTFLQLPEILHRIDTILKTSKEKVNFDEFFNRQQMRF